ncbi:MAG TPA: hypothetical protein VMQ17_02985 [Candidatus Sulfotelmatobacter sp.]|nr:hypothetical protein [Candidatus Sulfotelmatobacter sp.]
MSEPSGSKMTEYISGERRYDDRCLNIPMETQVANGGSSRLPSPRPAGGYLVPMVQRPSAINS